MKRLLFNSSIYFVVAASFGQSPIVSGTIVDQTATPLPGVTITVEGTKWETQTDFDGKFSIAMPKAKNLMISYLGFKTKKVKIKTLKELYLQLTEEGSDCFATRDADLAFKIYDISADHIITHQDMYNAIRSKVPGLTISSTNLYQTPLITMRGDPYTVVMVDGVRYDAAILNTLNPQDIEKIEVATSIAASNYLMYNRY